MSAASVVLSRRSVLQGFGALIVSCRFVSPVLAQEGSGQKAVPELPGSLAKSPYLDAWIRIGSDNSITVLTGKAELGQGIKTALLQIAAEQLAVDMSALKIVMADTELTANEGYTAGSHSMQDSGTAILNAAAQARMLLISEAAKRWGIEAEKLRAENGAVIGPDGKRATYGEIVSDQFLHVEAQPQSQLIPPSEFKVMGRAIHRIDIPAKVTGGVAYVHDLRLPGMLHARVVRPPSYKASLRSADIASVERMPGVVRVHRDGNFLGVLATREYQAVKAMRALAASAQWHETPGLPKPSQLGEGLKKWKSQDKTILDRNSGASSQGKAIAATYTKSYTAHGSIGPSCAVAQFADGKLTIWTHTQGVYPDRKAIAELVRMPESQVHCIQTEGSGCYGHNGADDAAADAALLAVAASPRPVRLQWMREQEHGWEPYGPAMLVEVSGSVDSSGRVSAWHYELWSNTHTTRPGTAGSLLAGRLVAQPFKQPEPKPIPLPEGGGDRNAIPLYAFADAQVVHHFLPDMPVRVSAQRSLGAYMNVFAIESFMDELAAEAGADPVEFRLAHLGNQRAKDVIQLAAQRFGWRKGERPRDGRGIGFAFAQYKNLAAYCAIAAEVEVDRATGRARLMRAVSAVDAGQIVNPDGIRNQIEGGILQSASWTLFESVSFDDTHITSIDWASYPILRFDGVPDSVEVHLIDRPGQLFLGAGEASQGPAAAAIGNAIANATGKRFRDLPLSPDRLFAALNV
ncbi:MAG TPA: molybdopterin cofactor-binding domain-containing protein [Hyphomicrobiales bacterium]|nr:molybdopterin cofactor-binding domain-containing protein [Hyphomicrobiales bacterium]